MKYKVVELKDGRLSNNILSVGKAIKENSGYKVIGSSFIPTPEYNVTILTFRKLSWFERLFQ